MKIKPTKFDALANVLYTENEVIPDSPTRNLREDSFAEPAQGYSKEDWMALPYRKRRYIVLRDRARSVTPGSSAQPAVPKTSALPPKAAPLIEPDIDAPGIPNIADGEDSVAPDVADDTTDDDTLGYDDVVTPPTASARPRTNAYGDAITNFVSSNPGSSREDIVEYLAGKFGDRLNTTDEISDVIAQAVGNGDISFDTGDVAHVGEIEGSDDTPSDADVVTHVKSDADKARDRASLVKKFLAWRKAKSSGELDADEDESKDEDGDDDDEPTDAADKIVGTGKGIGRRLNRAGIDWQDNE